MVTKSNTSMKLTVSRISHLPLPTWGCILVFHLVMIHCSPLAVQNSSSFSKQTFRLNFSNSDLDKIGMKKFDDGSEQSVTSIYRINNLIYIVDPVHSNVKSISVPDGRVSASLPISTAGELSDLTVIDSLLYIISTSGDLITLDMNLRYMKSAKLPVRNCNDLRFLKANEHNYVFCPGDINQDKVSFEITIPSWELDAGTGFREKWIEAGKGFEAYQYLIQGYKLLGNDSCLQFKSVTRCIDRPLPTGQNFPTARTVSLTSNSLTLFVIENNQLLVYSYEWPQSQNHN